MRLIRAEEGIRIMSARIAIDIGGTFTDVVRFDNQNQKLVVGKTLSTPHDLIVGIMTGVADAETSIDDVESMVHGSTVVINALIERKGARAALITTRGFRDVYEIGRVNRPDAFNLNFEKFRPLIPRERVFECSERMRFDGTVIEPIDERQLRDLAARLCDLDVEAVAVVLLHSYRNPEHELVVGRILAEELPGRFVTLSHELTREYREFERTSTTAANAFVGPAVARYLDRLESSLRATSAGSTLSIMQSNGGLSDVATIQRQAVQMMESGPAGGVVGTIELCKRLGYQDAIAFDMGGTTAKASVIRGQSFPQAAEYFVGGYVRGLPIRIPCLDIVEVGTGGGSVAWVDSAGGIHVGPQSAGASPGPACYGLGGTEPTVTDAAVVLGLLDEGRDLSGGLRLDGAAARRTTSELADAVGLDPLNAASGVLAIAASSMTNAIRAVTTERGLDPRDFTVFAYGGNGPLHISLVARELGIRSVVIPPAPAVFSAVGMLMADVRHDFLLTDVRRLSTAKAQLELDYQSLEKAGRETLRLGGIAEEHMRFVRFADLRYVGQEHSISVQIPDIEDDAILSQLKAVFDKAHLERFSHAAPDEEAEIVTMKVSAIGTIPRPEWSLIGEAGDGIVYPRARGERKVVLDPNGGAVTCRVYNRADLLAGHRIDGPAAVEEGTTTTLLRAGDSLTVDTLGNLLIQIGEA
jgi:N-methylhydantoinase A